jgi:hypothetical protein
MKSAEFPSNRVVPKAAMRCIACDRVLPDSANAMLAFLDDRWSVWHRSCFARSWREEDETGGF